MKNAKKILALLLCAILLVGASVAGTLAYLTSQDEVVNNFTVGQVKITLDEAPVNEDGEKTSSELKDRVQTNDYHLLPGHYYSKDPQVHVLADSEDCYVRMFVTITKADEWDTICSKYGKSATDLFVGLNNTAWTYKSSTPGLAGENTRTYEFWYSSKVTDVPENANLDLAALFQGLQMPNELTNEDLDTLDDDFKIYVVAQAIQADGFDDDVAAFDAAPEITGNKLIPGVDTTTP